MDDPHKTREQLYRSAIEAAHGVPYARNYVTGRFDFVGPGIRELLGYTPEEFTVEIWNASVLEVLPFGKPSDLPPAEVTRQLCEADSPSWWADLRVRTASGCSQWSPPTRKVRRERQTSHRHDPWTQDSDRFGKVITVTPEVRSVDQLIL